MFKTLKDAFKVREIRNGILFTFFILIIVRLGSAIPVPGVRTEELGEFFAGKFGNASEMLDALTGGSFSRMTIFALSVTPYITSSIILQLLTIAIPALEEMQKDGDDGRKKITAITRVISVALAIIEGVGLSVGFGRSGYLEKYNFTSVLVIVITLTAGSTFIMWLGERVTERGVGNGISIILLINIIARMPSDLKNLYNMFVKGKDVVHMILAAAIIIGVIIVTTVLTILLNDAERKIPVSYAQKIRGRRSMQMGAKNSYIPLKVNTGNVMPIIFASTLMSIPTIVTNLFSINVKRDTAEVSFSIYMMYEDTGYAVNSDFYLGGFEDYFDKVCADPGSVDPYNNSALDTHLDDLKNDFPIHFARMVAFSDEALSGIGLGLKDLGIDLGDKYRNMDPRQLTSKDVEITNEHKFENGFCTDCGMSWTEYYYEVVKKFSNFDLGNGQYSTSGQESASMISRTDQVQYSADGESYGSMYYHHSDIDNDIGTDKDDWCYIDFSNYNKKINIEVFYEYDLKKFSTGGETYRYSLNFKSEAGQLDKVFESKEAFEKCITVSMDIISKDRDNDIYDAWKTMKEEDIRQMMEADSLTYLTKDEFINRFWDLRANFFTSLDNGMVWMKTSLKDFGFNWK